MYSLQIDSTVIDYSIRRSLRAKYVSIAVGPDGIEVIAPNSMKDCEIIPLVENKRKWIAHKFERVQYRLTQANTEHWYLSGETLTLLGHDYPLKLIEQENRATKIVFTDGQFLIYICKDISPAVRRELIHSTLGQWYQSYAKELIPKRMELFLNNLGMKVNKIRFKNQKTRWGSCSQKGNLNFNWKLIMAPLDVIDYVIVHELSHLRHMNHSKEFWQVVSCQIPDYQQRRTWLKENGLILKY